MKRKITLLIVALLLLQPFLTMLTYATAENDVQVFANENESNLVTAVVSDGALYDALKAELSKKLYLMMKQEQLKLVEMKLKM